MCHSELIAALDSAAAAQQRDRNFIIDEAIDQYLSLQEYHLALIDEGIRQAAAGNVVSHEEVEAMAASWSERARGQGKH
jgi:predicted transcriptional regulator